MCKVPNYIGPLKLRVSIVTSQILVKDGLFERPSRPAHKGKYRVRVGIKLQWPGPERRQRHGLSGD